MPGWFWLLLGIFIGANVGLLVACLCVTAGRKEERMDLREKMARYAHDVWKGWARDMMDEENLSDHRVERWKHYFITTFDDLTDDEKRTDYVEADTILSLIGEETARLRLELVGYKAECHDDEEWITKAKQETARLREALEAEKRWHLSVAEGWAGARSFNGGPLAQEHRNRADGIDAALAALDERLGGKT